MVLKKTELNKINFLDIILLDIDDIESYCFEQYHINGDEHPIKSYCTSCEEEIGHITDEEGFALYNISHGTYSSDFIAASNSYICTDGWNEAGVMFVMENPSKDYDIYKTVEVTKEDGATYAKRPSRQWYWIHNKQDILEFPNNFAGRKYGEFVASAIYTFRLKNAYLTNLVKCGLNTPDGQSFKGTNSYNPECVRKCYSKNLCREIELVKPRVIFAFGRNTYDWLRELTNGIKIVMLPHPARSQNGFTNDFYQTLYFCLIAKWLCNENVISNEFYAELMQKYADAT